MERIFGQPLANGFPTAHRQLGVWLGHFNITCWLSALLNKRQCGTVRSKVKDGDIYNLVLGRRSWWQRRHGYVALRRPFNVHPITAKESIFCCHFHTVMPTLHWYLINENGDIILLCLPVRCKMFHRYTEARQTKGVHAKIWNFCENFLIGSYLCVETSNKPTMERQKRNVRDLCGR